MPSSQLVQLGISLRLTHTDDLAKLRAAKCLVDEKVDESEYGKFGWVVDPEGNKIELWEPPA